MGTSAARLEVVAGNAAGTSIVVEDELVIGRHARVAGRLGRRRRDLAGARARDGRRQHLLRDRGSRLDQRHVRQRPAHLLPTDPGRGRHDRARRDDADRARAARQQETAPAAAVVEPGATSATIVSDEPLPVPAASVTCAARTSRAADPFPPSPRPPPRQCRVAARAARRVRGVEPLLPDSPPAAAGCPCSSRSTSTAREAPVVLDDGSDRCASSSRGRLARRPRIANRERTT